MNEKNLIPNSERTPEELREITRKGGIASGESRRRRKTIAAALRKVLDEPVGNSDTAYHQGKITLITDLRDWITREG